jgi:hypothetical protein
MKKVLVFALLALSATTFGQSSFTKVFSHWSIMEEGELASHVEFEHSVTFRYDPNGKSSLLIKNDASPITQIYRQQGKVTSNGSIYGFNVKNSDGYTMQVYITEDKSMVMIGFTSDLSWVYNDVATGNETSL